MDTQDSKKKINLLNLLYEHCAQHGMSQLQSISSIARILDIKRSLFYFYFKDLESCLSDLLNHHKHKADVAFKDVLQKELTFLGYVHYMIDIKEIYFFSMQCVRYQSQHSSFLECLEYSLKTLDDYNCKQFIIHYQLDQYPVESMQFMYASFREYWWTHSGEYESWTHSKIDQLVHHVDELVEILKSNQR